MRQWPRAFAFLCASLAPAYASAWQIEDPIHENCHERISQAALNQTGYVNEPPPLEGDDASLRDNVEFKASRYDANIYALSLIIGVRNADTHGGMDFSFGNNASAANADDDQRAHCLRSKSQDGPAGDAAAIADCRAWIESLYWLSLSSLDAGGHVAADDRTDVTVATEFQGPVSYPVSQLYYFAGRAMHAVQDSFSHSFRSADGHSIRHVFNWSDQVSCTLDESRDGHGHETMLDHCQDGDPSEAERFELATQASTDLLSAITTPGVRAERAQRIADFLEAWMTYEPGCTLENDYCQSPVYDWLSHSDRSDKNICDGPLGCETASAPQASPASERGLLLGSALLFGAFALRRRRRLGAALALAAAVCAAPRAAQAEASGTDTPSRPEPRKVGGPRLEARGSLSVDNPAYAFGVAGLYGFKRADVGIFAELNPWYSIERRRMSLGSTNFGVLGHYLHPLRHDLVLRFGLGLGVSMLNADMLGVNAGNLGIYLNIRAMGLIWEFADGVALTADPLDIALPAPALVGWPILFTQYRTSLGLQFAL
jgi:MYXO-CTERM domain-containing protein